jgi:hypothetical protein
MIQYIVVILFASAVPDCLYIMLCWKGYCRKREGVVRTWEKAKLTIYIITW